MEIEKEALAVVMLIAEHLPACVALCISYWKYFHRKKIDGIYWALVAILFEVRG